MLWEMTRREFFWVAFSSRAGVLACWPILSSLFGQKEQGFLIHFSVLESANVIRFSALS